MPDHESFHFLYPAVTLAELGEGLSEELLEMAEEYRLAGDHRYQEALDGVTAYIARLRRWAEDDNLPEHVVPETTFWLVRERKILGRTKIRHRLNAGLEVEGGHIGYDIRPSERRKGYGTAILHLALEKAIEIGLRRVMLTCDADNVASARIIEKNGGKLSGTATSPTTGKAIFQYWIEL
jgi:predicted acetyltransferase